MALVASGLDVDAETLVLVFLRVRKNGKNDEAVSPQREEVKRCGKKEMKKRKQWPKMTVTAAPVQDSWIKLGHGVRVNRRRAMVMVSTLRTYPDWIKDFETKTKS